MHALRLQRGAKDLSAAKESAIKTASNEIIAEFENNTGIIIRPRSQRPSPISAQNDTDGEGDKRPFYKGFVDKDRQAIEPLSTTAPKKKKKKPAGYGAVLTRQKNSSLPSSQKMQPIISISQNPI